MNGAEALIATAASAGVEICFANPGTTELPLVQAVDTVPGLRSILCLHENVATGAYIAVTSLNASRGFPPRIPLEDPPRKLDLS
jgi:thiamine pyrophosphate-dependent acetolactate synthase large subunit-like protein